MGHILFIKNKETGIISFLTKDNILVANLSEECIMSYYDANKKHSSLSKAIYPEMQIVGLLTLLPELAINIKSLLTNV